MRVVLFASLRELAGASSLDLELAPSTVGSLIDHLGRAYGPEFVRIARLGSVVIDGDTVRANRMLQPDDEVVILPPVSGG